MKRALAVVVVLGLLFGLVGCKSIEEKIGEKVGEEIAGGIVGGDVDVDDDSVTIETDDGTVTMQGDATEIPEDFPGEFPLPDEFEVDSATSMKTDVDSSFYVNLFSPESVKDIYEWYKAEFTDGGWEITSDVLMSGDGDSGMLAVKKDTMEGTVSLYTEEGSEQTEIGIILIVK
ncbi:MAG: hypothetical protein EG823_02315 [Actinobacteria bacterium]|nr:hypothetical protein [Actinomycetota bacterium]